MVLVGPSQRRVLRDSVLIVNSVLIVGAGGTAGLGSWTPGGLFRARGSGFSRVIPKHRPAKMTLNEQLCHARMWGVVGASCAMPGFGGLLEPAVPPRDVRVGASCAMLGCAGQSQLCHAGMCGVVGASCAMLGCRDSPCYSSASWQKGMGEFLQTPNVSQLMFVAQCLTKNPKRTPFPWKLEPA